MAGAAAAVLRSVARRSKTPMLVGARSLARPQPQPQSASAVLSPRLPFDGGLRRRQELPPRAMSARLFSSGSPGSANTNPSPPCKEPAIGVGDKNKELPALELQRQIVYKQGELLQLLLQVHGGSSPSFSDSEKLIKEKGQLIHLLREFHAKTQCRETPELDAVVRFVTRAAFFCSFATIFMLVTM
ncbi:unnamed protein product [Urochloa humidicola]